MQKYKSTSKYRKMSSVQFLEEVMGIRLRWYYKLMLRILDTRDNLEKKYLPYRYWFRYFSR